VQQSQEQRGPARAIDVLKQLQERGQPEEQPEALEQLVALATTQQERGGRVRVVDGREVRSILITPTPTMTTLVNTVSFTTTVTKNITQDLDIFLNGRRLATHVVEQEVVVHTSTSLVSTTMEITPTPTWQTIIVTPTAPPPTPAPTPAPIDVHSLLQQKVAPPSVPDTRCCRPGAGAYRPDSEDPVPAGDRRPAGWGILRRHPGPGRGDPGRAGYLPLAAAVPGAGRHPAPRQVSPQVRRQKEEGPVAQPLVALEPSTPALPSTSVSTVFMSGARPGEYSTSLVTITLGTDRVRRAATELPSGIEARPFSSSTYFGSRSSWSRASSPPRGPPPA
jgi:hypothetical protein